MEVETIAINFIDNTNYGEQETDTKYYIYSSNVEFNFNSFVNDLEELHENNGGDVGFHTEVETIAKKHGLNETKVKNYNYEY